MIELVKRATENLEIQIMSGIVLPSAARTKIDYSRLLPSDFSKSLPEPDLKTIVVIPRAQISERALFIIGHERQTVRQAILDRKHLIRISGDVCRISYRHVLADAARDCQTRRRR